MTVNGYIPRRYLLAMAMIASGPGAGAKPTGKTDLGEERRAAGEAVSLGGSAAGPARLTKEKERQTRHRVDCGAQVQAPAGKNDQGDSERGGRGAGQAGSGADAGTEARTTVKRGRRHGGTRLPSLAYTYMPMATGHWLTISRHPHLCLVWDVWH